ncbi:MAG: HDOD domain-containing protein [Planctomycetota bacterium]|jgi:HD-like signal output (HDOD) protein
MQTAIYEKMKAGGLLPSPTGTALRILALTTSEDTAIEQVTAVIEADPDLASQLLEFVRSPVFAPSTEVTSVTQAVAFLGLGSVKGFALGLSLISAHKKGDCGSFDYEAFWSESAARAVTCRHVAAKLDNLLVDAAFICGLFCQIGRLAFATVYPKSYAAALDRVAPGDAAKLKEMEWLMFRIDRNELGARMMTDWHLPTMLCDAVRHQDSPGKLDPDSDAAQLARVLHFGHSVSALLTGSRVRSESLTALTLEANRLGISPAVVAAVFDSISDEWRSIGTMLAVATRRVPALAELYSLAR